MGIEMQGGEKWRGKKGDESSGKRQKQGHRRGGERDYKLSCGGRWSQTGSPDDTSVCLTHPDSNLTLKDLQTTQRGKTTHATVGLHEDDSGQFQAFY